MSGHTEHNGVEVPQTITPWVEVMLENTSVLLVFWATLVFSLDLFIDKYSMKWAGFLTAMIFGWMLADMKMAINIPDRYGLVLFNPITKRRRALFSGFNLKGFFERPERGLIPLKRDVHADDKPIRLPTKDPTEVMEVTLKIHMRVDTTGDPETDAENLIKWDSYEDDAIATLVRGEMVSMFAQYYGNNPMEKLGDPTTVQKIVLENPENEKRVQKLLDKFGMHIGVILETSQADEDTKNMNRTPARAEALRRAMDMLTDTGASALSAEQARRAALNLDPNADFSESHTDLDLTANVKGLENLRDVQFVPPGILGGGQKGQKK